MVNLPLFPLNLVLLPYEYLPLHIYEPRYKVMVKNSIEHDKPFGIVLIEGDDVHTQGCRVQITKVYKKYQNGEYDILVKGVERFKVLKTRLNQDTVIGEIEYYPFQKEKNELLINKLQDSYLKVLLNYGINTDLEIHLKKEKSFEFLQLFQIPTSLKKELISINSERKRLDFIFEIFDKILKSGLKQKYSQLAKA